MRIAFISDIHSNLEALKAVMADIEAREPDRLLCLGDVINYGPNPVECLRIARKLELSLMGNHEEAVLYEPIGFNRWATEAAQWTRAVLEPNFFSGGAKWADWNFLKSRPRRHEEEGVLMVHASPREPTGEYLLPSDGELILGNLSEKLAGSFERIDHLSFVGHTHIPGVFTEAAGYTAPADLDGAYRLEDGVKAIINVGSVGQPRDHDTRAAYATVDGEVVRFHRVEYDAEKTCEKVKGIEGLPNRGGERLLKGE
jgi:diadenosine tetraphosphatase ApaH/serine/threonine PP2A family protein phosphatase